MKSNLIAPISVVQTEGAIFVPPQTYKDEQMSNLSVFKDTHGIEIIIDEQTGESFCSVNGYARMSGKDKSTISRRLQGVWRLEVKWAEIHTEGGIQSTVLIPIQVAVNSLAKDKPSLVKVIIDTVEAISGVRVSLPSFAEQKRSKSKAIEKRVQNCLAKRLKGKTEVPCKSGVIDILTDTQIIEVKKAKHWKHAIGQVLVYQLEYPTRQARIHLCEECSEEFKQMVVSFSSRLSVIATFES